MDSDSVISYTYIPSRVNAIVRHTHRSGLTTSVSAALSTAGFNCISWPEAASIRDTPNDGSVLLGCSCHPSGVSPTECPPGGEACLCDPDTGTCPCLPSVTGRTCDHCAVGYWNLVPGRGCQPCDYDLRTLLSSHCDQARNFQLPMVSE